MKDLTFSGSMPYKIEGPLNLQDGFRALTLQMLNIMFHLLKDEKEKEYPYSGYSTGDESGIQLVIEADCFGNDFIFLRRHDNGYTLALSSDDCESIGSMEFEFALDDELTKLIPEHVKQSMEENLY